MNNKKEGWECNLVVFDDGKKEELDEREELNNIYGSDLVDFSIGLTDNWTTHEKIMFSKLPEAEKEAEMLRLIKLHKKRK